MTPIDNETKLNEIKIKNRKGADSNIILFLKIFLYKIIKTISYIFKMLN